jgi:hypothetical protein
MTRFLVTRTLPPLSAEQLEEVKKNVVSACDQLGMNWIGSYITADGKHSFCEFDAPNAELCREHASKAGLPVDDVVPIGMKIGPQ